MGLLVWFYGRSCHPLGACGALSPLNDVVTPRFARARDFYILFSMRRTTGSRLNIAVVARQRAKGRVVGSSLERLDATFITDGARSARRQPWHRS